MRGMICKPAHAPTYSQKFICKLMKAEIFQTMFPGRRIVTGVNRAVRENFPFQAHEVEYVAFENVVYMLRDGRQFTLNEGFWPEPEAQEPMQDPMRFFANNA